MGLLVNTEDERLEMGRSPLRAGHPAQSVDVPEPVDEFILLADPVLVVHDLLLVAPRENCYRGDHQKERNSAGRQEPHVQEVFVELLADDMEKHVIVSVILAPRGSRVEPTLSGARGESPHSGSCCELTHRGSYRINDPTASATSTAGMMSKRRASASATPVICSPAEEGRN